MDDAKDDPDCKRYKWFYDLADGLTVVAKFEEKKGRGFSFFECAKPDLKERKVQYPEEFVDDLESLDDLLIVRSYAEIERMIHEEALVKAGVTVGDNPDTELETDTDPAPWEDSAPDHGDAVPEVPESAPEPSKKKRTSVSTQQQSQVCPHGHNFGTEDFGAFTECDECAVAMACRKACLAKQ